MIQDFFGVFRLLFLLTCDVSHISLKRVHACRKLRQDGGLGYLTLWPDGQPKPLVSTLNALDGSISNNMAIVPNTDGSIDAYAPGITQLILDISSYFAP